MIFISRGVLLVLLAVSFLPLVHAGGASAQTSDSDVDSAQDAIDDVTPHEVETPAELPSAVPKAYAVEGQDEPATEPSPPPVMPEAPVDEPTVSISAEVSKPSEGSTPHEKVPIDTVKETAAPPAATDEHDAAPAETPVAAAAETPAAAEASEARAPVEGSGGEDAIKTAATTTTTTETGDEPERGSDAAVSEIKKEKETMTMTESEKEAAALEAAAAELKKRLEAAHSPYRRMSTMGMPREEVVKKMEQDGVSEEAIKAYPETHSVLYTNPTIGEGRKEQEKAHCQVSAWMYSGDCSKVCGGGTQTRTRRIVQQPQHGGTPCPILEESFPCNTQSCRSTIHPAGGKIVAWPMPRKDLSRARDGDTSSWTYTTAAWCEHAPFWVGLSFPQGALVSGIRVWKRHHPGLKKDCGKKDIEVVYSTDPDTLELGERDYKRVVALTSGYEGKEVWNASKIDVNMAKVFSETHDSETDGWASLSFNTVNATVIALQVDSLDPHYNHFCLGEIQAIQDMDAALLTKQLSGKDGRWADL